jgi:membrane-associated phospholipid phosphatase
MDKYQRRDPRELPRRPRDNPFTFYRLLYFFAGRRLGAYALFYSVFRVLPRLIVGAHWFSDVVVGSGCLALFFLSWTLCTPLHTWIIDRIEKFLTLWRKNEVQKELV